MNNRKNVTSTAFIWQQGGLPSQNIIDQHNEAIEKYNKWLNDYRQSHQGADPLPPKLVSAQVQNIEESYDDKKVNDIEDEDTDQNVMIVRANFK